MGTKPLCIIPARGNSKRLPGKNLRLLKGKTLVARTIEAALECAIFSEIVVSSEDNRILDIAQKYNVTAQRRGKHLSTDTSTVTEVCRFVIRKLEAENRGYDIFAVLIPTCPLRLPEDLKAGYKLIEEKSADAVMSVTPFSHSPLRGVSPNRQGFLEPFFGQQYMTQSQKLPVLYRHDGNFIFMHINAFQRYESFYVKRVFPYYIPPERGIDIDGEIDLITAEAILNYEKKTFKTLDPR